MPQLLRSSPFLFLAILVSVGCADTPKKASADDAAAIQHQGNRIIVPASSPLANRLEVEPVQLTSITRQVTAPASVEADPARYARILPPLNGRVLKLFVHPATRYIRATSCFY
jgi:multidrug efflux pump subunit AcrA (membrane-fusion protein)